MTVNLKRFRAAKHGRSDEEKLDNKDELGKGEKAGGWREERKKINFPRLALFWSGFKNVKRKKEKGKMLLQQAKSKLYNDQVSKKSCAQDHINLMEELYRLQPQVSNQEERP